MASKMVRKKIPSFLEEDSEESGDADYTEEEEEDESEDSSSSSEDDGEDLIVESSFYEDDHLTTDEAQVSVGDRFEIKGLLHALNRSSVDTVFKLMDDYKNQDSEYKKAEKDGEDKTCCTLLWSFFKKNYKKCMPGIYSASMVGSCLKSYENWVKNGKQFSPTLIRMMMQCNSQEKSSGEKGVFKIVKDVSFIPCPDPPTRSFPETMSPQAMGNELEPYIRKLVERRLFKDTGEEWRVYQSGTFVSENWLCICKIDGIAVPKNNPKERVALVEIKFVEPFKNYASFKSAIKSQSETCRKNLPVLEKEDGTHFMNKNHNYGNQTRLSMDILKLSKGFLIFGLKDLPQHTTHLSKIDYVEYKDTNGSYMAQVEKSLLDIIQKILIPLIVKGTVDYKGNWNGTGESTSGIKSRKNPKKFICIGCEEDCGSAVKLKAHHVSCLSFNITKLTLGEEKKPKSTKAPSEKKECEGCHKMFVNLPQHRKTCPKLKS